MSARAAVARLERERLHGERRRLAVLLQWLAVRACAPNAGRPLTADRMRQNEQLVAAELERVADAGALRYFEIASARDLGDAPVVMFAVDDPRWPYGTIALDLPPLVEHIMGGGDRGAGWRDPAEISAGDILSPRNHAR